MKANLHPQTHTTTYVCNSCKTTFLSLSTAEGTVNVEVCSNCHPVYTGEAGNVVDAFSRIDKFKKYAESQNTEALQLKKRKKIVRREKVKEIAAAPGLTLKDLLKSTK